MKLHDHEVVKTCNEKNQNILLVIPRVGDDIYMKLSDPGGWSGFFDGTGYKNLGRPSQGKSVTVKVAGTHLNVFLDINDRIIYERCDD